MEYDGGWGWRPALDDSKRPPVVALYDDPGIGLIISWASGVLYSNQTGGTACLAPRIEGVYVSLNTFNVRLNGLQRRLAEHFTGPKWRGACYKGIDAETADVIDAILQGSPDSCMVAVDRERLGDSHEAWVYVRIGEPPTEDAFPIFRGFGAARGVLTWENSD